jgi:hypothetical protein
MPQSRMNAFSAIRSWAIATAAAAGLTTQCRARNSSEPAGTFSNSVVTERHSAASSASAASSV